MRIETLKGLLIKYLDSDKYSVEELMEISYLHGVLTYNIWADCIPNGDKICDKYEKRLEQLTK